MPNNSHTETLKLTAHLLPQHPKITASKYGAHVLLQGGGPVLNRVFVNFFAVPVQLRCRIT